MLFLTALIWGLSFVAQSVGIEYVGTFTFNGSRFIIGGAVLIPCMFLLRFADKKTAGTGEDRGDRKRTVEGIKGGIWCGIALCVASAIQQKGIAYTTVGKAGFITALYIVIVPLFRLFAGKKPAGKIWVSVAAAVAGLYLLSVKEGFSVGFGEFLIFLCSLAFAVHILVVDHFSPKADGVFLSCIQFFTAGAISWVLAFAFETPRIQDVAAAWLPVLYAGVMSCGVAYTFQVIAQKNTDPTVASLLLSLESVFSALFGWLILRQVLAPKELLGCALVFGGVILAQLPEKK
ncbi:MAG TPA: DMT family transporter, partial [Candidatus Lachnoclostridium stercoravium]|nr:DMT family transporter [Candidatus Lachnoclostridium stercoravium]